MWTNSRFKIKKIYTPTLILDIQRFFSFIFHDYTTGSAKNEVGIKNLYMLAISIIRTFFQVHGNMFFLISKNILFLLPVPFIIYILVLVRNFHFQKTLVRRTPEMNQIFFRIHILVAVLQISFAFLAVGKCRIYCDAADSGVPYSFLFFQSKFFCA